MTFDEFVERQERDEALVKLLAERVMGFAQRGDYWVADGGKGRVYRVDLWNPPKNDADACAVLDKMAEHGISGGPLAFCESRFWACQFSLPLGAGVYREEVAGLSSASRRRAICVAALKAVGAWEDP